MAEPEVRIGSLEETTRDVPADTEMTGANDDNAEVAEALAVLDGDADDAAEGAEEEPQTAATPQLTFLDYLRSPLVEIAVGKEPVILTAHSALLERSPFLADAIAAFSEDATVRRVEFPDVDLDAMGSLLQYLYTGEYFPRRVGEGLEPVDSTSLSIDEESSSTEVAGEPLLRHARIYTLAERLGLQELKALAHAKVHRVDSTARGELAYARYVYGHTPRDDVTIRQPIAAFWGQRSHVLRHEAEAEFRALCIDHPDFGFDVLSWVLDAREKRHERKEGAVVIASQDSEPAPRSGRKRARGI